MKKVFLTISIFAFTLITVNAQTTKTEKPVETPAATTSLAEITFESELHDFGSIEYAGNGTYEFKFKNTGKEPLIISDAKGSCGCTVPTYPKNIPIMPGKSEIIKVTYDTKRPGPFTKTVTIHSNAKTPEKVITIKGNVAAAAMSRGGRKKSAKKKVAKKKR